MLFLKLSVSRMYLQKLPIFGSKDIFSMTDISCGTSSLVRIFFSTILVFKKLAKNWSSDSGNYAAESLKKIAS